MKTVVGVFPNAREAQLTADELEAIGLARADITFVDKSSVAERDLVSQLIGYGVPETTARQYVDSIDRGGTLESVRVRDEQVDETLSIMRRHSTDPAATGKTLKAEEASNAAELRGEETSGGDEVFSALGVDEPTRQDVELDEERVAVERHAVDREVDPEDADFREVTIEMVEMVELDETPLVVMRARVIEEVRPHRDDEHRSENVKGTVGKMNVDVEQLEPKDREPGRFESAEYEPHYQQIGDTEREFEQYEPAYKLGHELREDGRFEGRSWEEVEPEARTAWEEKRPNTWERFKASVRHAWDRIK